MKIVYTDVLVIGGGLAGLRLAIGAKRRGHDATISRHAPRGQLPHRLGCGCS